MQERIDTRPIKEIFKEARHIIDYSFTLDGKDYFQFNDFNSVPCERGFAALELYTELDQRCTKDYLKSFCLAGLDEFNNNKGIRITEIVKLFHQLQERLEMIIEPKIAYKLCSVVFFDANENPYRFEWKHCIEKAAIFEKADMDSFFLSQPITKLLPYTNSLGSDLKEYCQAVNAITKEHIEHISTMLSEASKRQESFRSLMLQNNVESVSAK